MISDFSELLEKSYNANPDYFGLAVIDKSLIQAVEKKLNVKFSDHYIYFLEKFGGAILDGHIVVGVISDPSNAYMSENISDKTHFYGKSL